MKQILTLNSRITPDFYIDPAWSNTKKRDTYELLARIKVNDAMAYVRTGKSIKKTVPPRRLFRYLNDVPIEDLMQELIRRQGVGMVVNDDCDEVNVIVRNKDLIEWMQA